MTELAEYSIAFLLIFGSLFMLVAALGVLKLKDVYMRMHAITKASSLGTVLFLIAIVIAIPSFSNFIISLLVILFIIFTAPVASNMISRVAHMMGVSLSKGAVMDELEEDPIIPKKKKD